MESTPPHTSRFDCDPILEVFAVSRDMSIQTSNILLIDDLNSHMINEYIDSNGFHASLEEEELHRLRIVVTSYRVYDLNPIWLLF